LEFLFSDKRSFDLLSSVNFSRSASAFAYCGNSNFQNINPGGFQFEFISPKDNSRGRKTTIGVE